MDRTACCRMQETAMSRRVSHWQPLEPSLTVALAAIVQVASRPQCNVLKWKGCVQATMPSHIGNLSGV